MARYIRNTALFLLVVVLSLWGVEAFVRSIPNPYKLKDQRLMGQGDDISVLILGNSHNYYGIMPSFLGHNAFNAACVSQTFDKDFYLLKRYYAKLPKLKYVIINVDFSNLFDPPLEATEAFRLTYYHLYMGWPLRWGQKQYCFELANIAATREKVIRYFSSKTASVDAYGWGTDHNHNASLQTALSPEAAKARAETLKCKNLGFYAQNTQELCQIADFCARHHLRLIVLSTPVHPLYFRQVAQTDKLRLKHTIERLHRYGGVNYYDYSVDDVLEDVDFFDCDHLSDTGAKKFSKQLSEVLDRIVATEEPPK